MATEPFQTMIVLTTGKQDRGTRATLAFSWGCAALAMGQRVAIYLTMDGTVWAGKTASHGVAVSGFEPLEAYVRQFSELGGEMLVCAPCSEYYCIPGASKEALIENCRLVGLATVVSLISSETRVITF